MPARLWLDFSSPGLHFPEGSAAFALPAKVGWPGWVGGSSGATGRGVAGGLTHWFGADSTRLECEDPREVLGEGLRMGPGSVWSLTCGWLLGISRLRFHLER